MILRRTCKEAAALLVAREDRRLPLADRVALRLHLAACDACPRLAHQLELMRRAFGAWRRHAADDHGDESPPAN
jgi:Putative zinc-finger